MIEIQDRVGNFTSSQIFRIVGTPSVRDTYLKDKRAERGLNRSIDLGAYSQEMCWGKIIEAYFFLQEKYFPTGSGYSLCSKSTQRHPKYNFWVGSCDVQGKNDAGEIKCFYPKNYHALASALLALKSGKISLENFKSEFKEIYWQVVSNAIILGKTHATIFAYTPTKDELEDCILLLEETNFGERIGLDPWMFRFIIEAKEKEQLYKLPYIDPEKTDFPNEVRYTFEVPTDDIILLTKKVNEAYKLLQE